MLLTGSELTASSTARRADALLRKPFSPLELLSIVERLAGGMNGVPLERPAASTRRSSCSLYASDLRHLVEIERSSARC